jgi:hypothetical protein
MIIFVSILVVLSIALFVLWINAKEDLEDEIYNYERILALREGLLRVKDQEIIALVRKEHAYRTAYKKARYILFHEYGRGLDRVKTY